MSSILSVQSVSKQYKKNEIALKKVSLEINTNTFTVIVGQSGSGKSTLLNIISGLLKPTEGKVIFNGNSDIANYSHDQMADFRRKDIGQIFQKYYLLSNLTVEENIKLGIHSKKECYSIDELLKTLQIESIRTKFPSELSGGQQQRTAIARALIKKPKLLFCDEATGALDEENSKIVIQLLHDIQKSYGITILFITHNLEIAKTAHRIITLKDGKIHKDEQNPSPLPPSKMNWAE